MIVGDDRTGLDQALSNPRRTLLILSGSEKTKAGEIHKAFVGFRFTEIYKCFLITDRSLLTNKERTTWFEGDNGGRFAVLKGTNLPKRLVKKGPVGNLLRVKDRRPDKIKIRLAIITKVPTP